MTESILSKKNVSIGDALHPQLSPQWKRQGIFTDAGRSGSFIRFKSSSAAVRAISPGSIRIVVRLGVTYSAKAMPSNPVTATSSGTRIFRLRSSRQSRAAMWSLAQKNALERTDEAIVTALSVSVRSMPDASGTELFTVHEGMKVRLTDEVGEWVEVIFPNGSKGWMLSRQLTVI